MRVSVIAFVLAACASPNGTFDPSVTPRPADAAPQPVLDARAHVVAVYVNASCDALPTDSMERGVGFWVNSTTVATAGHAMDIRKGLMPEFAIVGPDGCMSGRYADWFEHVDLLFIMVSGRHEGAVSFAREPAPMDAPLWQYVFQGRDDRAKTAVFTPMRVVSEALETGSKVFFGSRPTPAVGDSGAPVFDAEGRLVGMTQAIGNYPKKPERGTFGIHLNAYIIRHYLAQCAGGGPCGDETP